MNGKPQSVSIEKLSAAIAEATKTHRHFAGGELRPGFFPDPGVLGYILRDADLGLAVKDLQAFATDVTSRAGIAAKPAFVVIDKDIIAGFFPVNEILFER